MELGSSSSQGHGESGGEQTVDPVGDEQQCGPLRKCINIWYLGINMLLLCIYMWLLCINMWLSTTFITTGPICIKSTFYAKKPS